ncbi:MAG TPA: outer membrane protein assembly factor BamA [Deltaproteobacteria bacterium]|nr:outer membrane protein assembly factor BamA [Deltaproteobacteria bacterium]
MRAPSLLFPPTRGGKSDFLLCHPNLVVSVDSYQLRGNLARMFKKILILLVCFLSCQVAYGQETIKIGIFPFQINSPENLGYLKEKISDILISHIKENEGASFIEKSVLEAELKGRSEGEIDEDFVRRVGIKLGADFVIWGSFTKIGKGISFDTRVLEIRGHKSPIRIYIDGRGLDTLTSKLGELARHINLKLLGEDIIVKISIKGNDRIEADAIKSHIKSKEGEVLSQKTLREDLKSIYDMDYFEDVNVSKADTPSGKEITFVVSEKPSIKEINISGNRFIEKKDIMEVIGIKPRTILNFNKIEDSIKSVLKFYRDKGYWAAEVDYKVYYLKRKEAIVDLKITENKKTKIKNIRFIDNKAYSDKELRGIIQTDEKGFFSWLTDSGVLKEDVLQQDQDKIIAFYSDNGYIDIKVGKPEITHDKDWIYITVPINEGKQFKVGKVDIKGDLIGGKEELLKKLNMTTGKIFSRQLLRKDVVNLTDKYAGAGYAFADVTPLTSIDRETQLVDLTLDVHKGKKVHFERISITGNTRTRDKVIRRELKVAEGDLYDKEKLSKSYQKVNRLGYFEEVSFDTGKGTDDEKLNLNIKVKEKPTGAVSVGAGYSSVDNVIGMFNITQNNLFGRGQNLFFVASLGGQSSSYNLGFTEPWLFDTPVSAGFDIYDVKRDYLDYSKHSQGGDIRFGFPITEDYTRAYATYKYENVNITNVLDTAAAVIKEQEGKTVTSSIVLSLVRDSKDDRIFPTKGSENSIAIEYAGGVLGGTNYFTKYYANTTWFFPLSWDTVFMSRARIGFAHGNQGRELPLFERFFLGGINSLRGFKAYSVGPKDPATGDVIGGNKELLFNIEYIFPLFKKAGIKGLVFFDAGNTFDDNENYSLSGLRTSVGTGIRWYSPIGPLRLEWGYNIDPRPGEKSSNWEFAIGVMF